MLSAKRIRESLSVFASVLAVVAIVAALGVGLLGFLASAATDGVRADLGLRHGAELSLRLSQLQSADPAAQDRGVRAVVASEFTASGRPIALEIDRTLASRSTLDFTTLGTPTAEDGRVVVASAPALASRTTLVDGAWPADDDEVSIQADAAIQLGLVVGDRIRIGGADLTISASWRVDDSLDPVWAGESVMITGVQGTVFGPLVVAEEAWPLIGETPLARWTLVPEIDTITSADLEAIAAVWPTLGDALDDAEVGEADFAQENGLIGTADELSARVHALDAVKPIALLMIAAIALVTLLELGRLLTEIREFELELLWARGATAGELARTTAVETGAVAVLGAGLGVGVAVGILTALSGPDAVLAAGAALWVVPLITVLVAISALGAQTYGTMRRGARRDAPERSGRVRRVAGAGVVVLLSLAAAVSVGQLRLYGSPVTPVAGGGTAVDPVTVVAPALALIALVLIGLLAFPRIAPLAERMADRRLGVDRILAARSVARRLTLVATPIVLVALACGQFVVAGGYAATWEGSFTRTQELRAGTSTKVTTSFIGLSDAELDQIATTDGVHAVAPVYIGELKTAGDYASVSGITPRAFADLAMTADGTLDPSALATTIDVGLSQLGLPIGAGDLGVSIDSRGFLESPSLSVWIGDDFGQVRRISLTLDAATESTVRYSAPVPAPVGADNTWHLTALDVTATGADASPSRTTPDPHIDVVAMDFDGTPVELGGTWEAYGFGDLPGSLGDAASEHGTSLTAGTTLARLFPVAENGADPIASAIPIVISSTLAERIGAEVGTEVWLPLLARTEPVATVVAAVIAGVPGASDAAAVLVDLSALETLQLRTFDEPASFSTLWIGATDPRQVGNALRPVLPGHIEIEVMERDPDRAMLGSAVTSLWIAAIGSALLALAALAAVAGAQLRGRRGEVVVLRAIGMGSRQQGRIRRREFSLVSGYGIAIGLIAGAATVLATTAPLARSAVPDSYPEIPTVTMLDPLPLGLALLGLLLLVAGTIVVYANTVVTQARTLGGQEDVR